MYNMVMVYPQRPPQVFLSKAQFEARIGLQPGSLSGATLPPPHAIIGPVNKEGSLPRGTVRGWLPETIDYWKRARLGQGFRSDVRQHPRTSGGGRGRAQRAESCPGIRRSGPPRQAF